MTVATLNLSNNCVKPEERISGENHESMTKMTNNIDHPPKQQQQQQQQQLQNGYKQATTTTTRKLAQFYDNKTILITGATGFVGKVCLLRLVCSLGNCKRIYVMLRSKKGLTSQQRFNKMLQEAPFNSAASDADATGENHHHKQPDAVDWSKVVAVEGDMSCENLGFSSDIRDTMCKSVEIIFNIAASVQFDAPLKQNLRDNYLGVNNCLKLALDFDKLISFVHVSTFFTNSHMKHIEEKVVPMEKDCEKMAELISWLPDKFCDSMGLQMMENRPNTYVFTKAMAENLVQKYQGRLPIAIVRPSIVTPAVRDPKPGWVDNVNGPMGLGILASLGILRNIDWNYWGVADCIPVDYVVNTMLAVAERTQRLYPREIKVYNCSTSSLNPITWGEAFEVLRAESLKSPPYKMLRIPITVPRHKRANPIAFKLSKLSELLFAYFIDFILTICGQKRVLTRLTAKLHHGYEILKPFTTTEYTCSNENLTSAYEELEAEDRVKFNFDARQLDWLVAFRVGYLGSRSQLLKEDPSNVPAALFKMKILWLVEQTFKIMLLAFVCWNSYRLYGYFNQESLST